jgi:hypothetical protein
VYSLGYDIIITISLIYLIKFIYIKAYKLNPQDRASWAIGFRKADFAVSTQTRHSSDP